MKITGPDQTSKTGSTKKTDKARSSGSSGFSSLLGADEASETAHSVAAGTIARVDVLLAAQSVEDPQERAARQRMRKRADGILHELDKIRLGILTGHMTVGNMMDIADVVASHRERLNDPQLVAILDEIDLRAQIEIAKMKAVLDARVSAGLLNINNLSIGST